jgi:hypothetical protein
MSGSCFLQRHYNSKYLAMFQYPAGRKLGSYRDIILASDSEYLARFEYPSDWWLCFHINMCYYIEILAKFEYPADW